MLKKLIKYDFRALSRVLFPMEICVLAGTILASILTTISIRITNNAESLNLNTRFAYTFEGIAVFLSTILIIAVAASLAVVLMFILIRFYKSFLEDEGYLMFTLPVGAGKLMLSKLITGMLWLVIAGIVVSISAAIYTFFGTASNGLINREFMEFFGFIPGIFRSLNEVLNASVLTAEGILWCLAVVAANLSEMYFSILVGGQIAKKHRILAGIGMYLVINFVVGIVRTILLSMTLGSGMLSAMFDSVTGTMHFVHGIAWGLILTNVLLTVVFFFWSRSILTKKLNLQ